METYQQHFDISCELRNKFWEAAGEVDSDVIAHMINPAFMGGPMWPSVRQAFITVRQPDRTILASDGLSDPYSNMESVDANAAYNGLGLEVYTAVEPVTVPVQQTWQFQLLYQAAQLMADAGNVVTLLNDMTWITTEFYDVDVPADFRNSEGRVGAILGLKDDTIPDTVTLSLEEVKIVNVKLLTLSELEYVALNGADGRIKLAGLLQQQKNATLSTLTRPSLV